MRENLLRMEVEELTEALRTDRVLNGLRKGLVSKGVSPGSALLAGFMETEDGREFGVIVADTQQVFAYERRTESLAAPNFISWKEHGLPPPAT